MSAIEVRNLVKSYKEVPVLDDVSFAVGRGRVFALLGANGSGKTTTINILTTLIGADGGTASVAGFDVAEQPARVREQISVTGQSAAVDHVLTARENLVLMGELRHVADPERTAADLLDKFDLRRRRRRVQLHPAAADLHQPFVRPVGLHNFGAARLRREPADDTNHRDHALAADRRHRWL
jgi:ABC-type multidrug transport system ATPase subunit